MLGRLASLEPPSRLAGLLPRAFALLLEEQEAVIATGGRQALMFGAIDVYNEAAFDLLDETTPRLAVREHSIGGAFFAAGAQWRSIESAADAEAALADASRHRAVGAHALNRDSSRSHAVFTVMVQTFPPGASDAATAATSAVLVFVDLAGSERRKQTGTSGHAADESAAINKSLLALNRCVTALAEASAASDPSSAGGTPQPRPPHVPYRSSVLTRLLRSVLDGPARIKLLACVSPAESQVEHTTATLQYAARASGIRSKPARPVSPAAPAAGSSSEVAGLRSALELAREEVARLRGENATLRRQLLVAGMEPDVPPRAPTLGRTATADAWRQASREGRRESSPREEGGHHKRASFAEEPADLFGPADGEEWGAEGGTSPIATPPRRRLAASPGRAITGFVPAEPRAPAVPSALDANGRHDRVESAAALPAAPGSDAGSHELRRHSRIIRSAYARHRNVSSSAGVPRYGHPTPAPAAAAAATAAAAAVAEPRHRAARAGRRAETEALSGLVRKEAALLRSDAGDAAAALAGPGSRRDPESRRPPQGRHRSLVAASRASSRGAVVGKHASRARMVPAHDSATAQASPDWFAHPSGVV